MDIDVSGWQGPQGPRPGKNSSLAKISRVAKTPELAKAPDLTKAPASLLFVATDLLARAFAERVGRHNDLTLPEWRCMMVLARRPGLANIEVAEASGLDVMMVSRALRRLAQHGHLERRSDISDKRRITASLTARGLDLYRNVAASAERLFEALNAQDRVRLGRYLKAIGESLR
ncbi:MAG: MarR family transcriptional regulator [Hyphomicrobiales bacterium]|nr:MarR family transcriptional regulator [Hyphomicrobiales bacterium]